MASYPYNNEPLVTSEMPLHEQARTFALIYAQRGENGTAAMFNVLADFVEEHAQCCAITVGDLVATLTARATQAEACRDEAVAAANQYLERARAAEALDTSSDAALRRITERGHP